MRVLGGASIAGAFKAQDDLIYVSTKGMDCMYVY